MFASENVIRRDIASPEGESEFQLRVISREGVGIATARSGKSYFLLDSGEYWYDLIQARYPAAKRCRCGNDFFRLRFDYVPRQGTEDFRQVDVFCTCAACGREYPLLSTALNYFPTAQLFHQPLTFCPKPRLKYRAYHLQGFWADETLASLVDFLLAQRLHVCGLCWDDESHQQVLRIFSPEEL